MANFKKNDEAVSAVIGVILMVAITVILAAVIAAFVFQLGGNVPKSKQVGIDVKRLSTNSFLIKTMSGTDVALLCDGTDAGATPSYTATVTNPDGSAVAVSYSGDPEGVADEIGETVTVTATGTTLILSGADVTIIAHFTDGTTTAIWSGSLA